MINKELGATLGFAAREAKKRRHEYLSIEHMLFAILNDSAGIEIIESCGGNIKNLSKAVEDFLSDRMESVPEGSEYVLQQTIGFQRMIKRAVSHVRSAEKQEVTVGDILASMFQEKDSYAAYFLAKEGITRLDVLHYIFHEASDSYSQGGPGDLLKQADNQKRKKQILLRLLQ